MWLKDLLWENRTTRAKREDEKEKWNEEREDEKEK